MKHRILSRIIYVGDDRFHCECCGKHLEVDKWKTIQIYQGPDSLDFSSSHVRIRQMLEDGTLYRYEKRPASYRGGAKQTITLRGLRPFNRSGLKDYSRTYLLCHDCYPRHLRAIKRVMIGDLLKSLNKELKDNIKTVELAEVELNWVKNMIVKAESKGVSLDG